MITDLKARQIADAWHGGQTSGLYAFQSSGAITGQQNDEFDYIDALTEIRTELEEIVPENAPDDVADLTNLAEYIKFHGIRGPIIGWASSLRW